MAESSRLEQLDQAIGAALAGVRQPRTDDPELAALIEVCGRLRDLPGENFKARLKAELERRASMSPSTAAHVREGFRTVTPCIIVPGAAQFVEFATRTFDAQTAVRDATPASFAAEVRIGESPLVVIGGEAVRYGVRTSALHVYVPDCDAAYRRALEAGASSMGEPADRPYGERSGFVKDAAGNHWYIATRLAGHYAPEQYGDLLPYLLPSSAARLIEFLERAFGARELQRFEQAGRVMHAAVRIGDSVVEMGEPDADSERPTSSLQVYVENADAAYERALAAGAISLRPPADQPSGDRSAVVQDPFGYLWFPATPILGRTR